MTKEIPVIKRMFYHNETFYCFYNGKIKKVDRVNVKGLGKSRARGWIDPKGVSIRTLRVYKIEAIEYPVRENDLLMGSHIRGIYELDDINVVHDRYIVSSKNNIVTGFIWLGSIEYDSDMYNGRRREGVITTLKKLDSEKYDGYQVR